MSVSLSVRRSVGPLVRLSVRMSRVIFEGEKLRILGASCAVYPALFDVKVASRAQRYPFHAPHLVLMHYA